MNILIVNLTGLLLIGGIVWWFWLSKSRIKLTQVDNFIEVSVKDGVYKPAYIQVQTNHPFTLRFTREDASPCAEIVIFTTLNISQQLPLHQPTDIRLTLKNPGEYEFTCQMGMYRGKLIAI